METKENKTVVVNLDELKKLLNQSKETETKVAAGNGAMEIDLLEIVRALVRRWWLILVAVFVCGCAALVVFISSYVPTYVATGKMYVNNKISISTASISLSDMNASVSLIDTYSAILKTRMTLKEVCSELKENYGYVMTYSELINKISVASVDETQVFYIAVQDEYPDRAIAIVNTIIDVLPIQISSVIEGSTVRTVDMAEEASPVSSGLVTYIIIGILIGAVISCGYIILADCVFNDKIEESDWLRVAYPDIPVLAEIPDQDAHNRTGKYYRSEYYRNHYASAYSSKKNN